MKVTGVRQEPDRKQQETCRNREKMETAGFATEMSRNGMYVFANKKALEKIGVTDLWVPLLAWELLLVQYPI